jgi:DNA invertase Pin-like site-specific DNA recombinase
MLVCTLTFISVYTSVTRETFEGGAVITGDAVVGYIRVSTDEQGRNGYGMEAQRQAIEQECQRRGWQLIRVFEDVASGKSTNGRHGLRDAIAVCDRGEARGLIAAKVDRISRSVADFAALLQQAQRRGWNLCVLDLGVDLSTPMGEAMASMAMTFAQLERRMISQRTKDGLAVARTKGVRLGRAVVITPALRQRVRVLREGGLSVRAAAARLNAEGVPSPLGGRWHPTSVVRALAQPVR